MNNIIKKTCFSVAVFVTQPTTTPPPLRKKIKTDVVQCSISLLSLTGKGAIWRNFSQYYWFKHSVQRTDCRAWLHPGLCVRS